jgi:lantibiotic biosynthesis protein
MKYRQFAPGSEWLYLKVYGGSETLNELLVDELAPLCRNLISQGHATKWFFVRYGNPEWHLRIRIHLSDSHSFALCASEFYRLMDPQLQCQVIHRVVLDTYQRELERYGGLSGMQIAEFFFYHDSECAVQLCRSLREAENDRWLVCCKGIDMLFNDFGFSLDARCQLVTSWAGTFANEFSLGASGEIAFGKKYREFASLIEQFIGSSREGVVSLEVLNALQTRSKGAVQVYTQLSQLPLGVGHLPTIAALMQSYVHMFTNRLFKTSGRNFEALVYALLRRYYQSQLARQKNK